MKNHEYVIIKSPMRWVLNLKFIAELKDNIFPKLGIVETKDIEKIITDLGSVVRKMREEGSKSMNAQLDWGSNEKPPATNEKTSGSNGKSPARKETPKHSSHLQRIDYIFRRGQEIVKLFVDHQFSC